MGKLIVGLGSGSAAITPTDLDIGRVLNFSEHDVPSLAEAYANLATSPYTFGALYSVDYTVTDQGGGAGYDNVALQVRDRFNNAPGSGGSANKTFDFEFIVEQADRVDGDDASHPVFYILSITAGTTRASQKANGSPAGSEGGFYLPKISGTTGNTGAATVKVLRVGTDGATVRLTNGLTVGGVGAQTVAASVDVRCHLDVQSAFQSWARMKRLTSFT